jgi:hypothetical protein
MGELADPRGRVKRVELGEDAALGLASPVCCRKMPAEAVKMPIAVRSNSRRRAGADAASGLDDAELHSTLVMLFLIELP